ncbi:type III PLP-dependent enzyme [Desertimonas flava]|uniref:type III PLP-dependent enzyme n=1 Tax=Desertimonas flava TaxID=2064846 RepID=UPI0019699A1C|nr:type III PLP-dependent enzyme [Desertimonas flava]
MTTQVVKPTTKLDQFLHEQRPPTPFVVVDVDVVADRYHELVTALPAAVVYYAVKANPAPAVLRRLVAVGSSFDVASPAEIDLCLEAGAVAGSLSYGNTVKKRRDVAYAASVGVTRYTVDAAEELDKVLSVAPGSSVCVRVRYDGATADWPLTRKFGCTPDEAARLLVDATNAGSECGISFHVGSQQRNAAAWDEPLGVVAGVFDRARDGGAAPSFVNLGGGLPGSYREAAPSLGEYGTAIGKALDGAFGDQLPDLMVEPGRYLVADAGVLRSEVVLVARRAPDEPRWVYLDCGKFHGLAETMDEAIRYRLRTNRDGGPVGPVAIAGPTCDSADVLYEKADYQLPLELAEGDMVDIMSAGAYTTTYSSVGFNGFAPLAEHYI